MPDKSNLSIFCGSIHGSRAETEPPERLSNSTSEPDDGGPTKQPLVGIQEGSSGVAPTQTEPPPYPLHASPAVFSQSRQRDEGLLEHADSRPVLMDKSCRPTFRDIACAMAQYRLDGSLSHFHALNYTKFQDCAQISSKARVAADGHLLARLELTKAVRMDYWNECVCCIWRILIRNVDYTICPHHFKYARDTICEFIGLILRRRSTRQSASALPGWAFDHSNARYDEDADGYEKSCRYCFTDYMIKIIDVEKYPTTDLVRVMVTVWYDLGTFESPYDHAWMRLTKAQFIPSASPDVPRGDVRRRFDEPQNEP